MKGKNQFANLENYQLYIAQDEFVREFRKIDTKVRLREIAKNFTINVLSFNRKLTEGIRGVYYHFIFDDQVDLFKRQLKFYKENYNVISLDEVVRLLSLKKLPEKKYCWISFDDGFKNNIVNAVKILKDFNMPATFFINTGFISHGHKKIYNDFYCYTRTMMGKNIEPLNWDDVKMMNSEGFEIGAHTVNHFRLSELSNKDAYWEISCSKMLIEDKLGQKCKYFSWPYGNLKSIRSEHFEMIRELGFDASCSAIRGVNLPGDDLYMIKRDDIKPYWPTRFVKYFLSRR